jgi:hypothetical protein
MSIQDKNGAMSIIMQISDLFKKKIKAHPCHAGCFRSRSRRSPEKVHKDVHARTSGPSRR